jgi:hypothetical protein
MKKITIELSADSCRAAVEELRQYRKEIKPKLDEVCKRLVEIGMLEAQLHLVLANGNTDATILQPVKIDNGYKLVMQGEDVYFVEFGTGDAANPNGYAVSVPVYPGSYSEGHAEKYATYGFWWYGGEKLTETPAYMPMYYAGKRMREELPRIVKEVFG